MTCTNGEGSGVVVPGTGIHLNNVMGEEDLNPLGFHRHPPGRRMPSMMAPTVVLRDGEVELVLGSAGSNRIRSALLQTIVGVVDHGLGARAAVAGAARALRGRASSTPSRASTLDELEREGAQVVRFPARNLFFGGVQAVRRRGRRARAAPATRAAAAWRSAHEPRAARGAPRRARRCGRRRAGRSGGAAAAA